MWLICLLYVGEAGEAWKWCMLLPWEEEQVREFYELLNPIGVHANVSERWLWQLHAKNKIKSMSLVLITTSPTGGSKLKHNIT